MKRFSAVFLLLSLILFSCKKKDNDTLPGTPDTGISEVYGFGILAKLPGIWNGPVTSTTALGSYPEWIVDFRPVSENQVSAKNELDTLNDIHMSFFIAEYDNQYRVFFRNGGAFGGQQRISYFMADSVSETGFESFYRFSEAKNGKSRAYTEILFRNDSLIVKTFTNQYNTLPEAVPHMTWSAKLQDQSAAEDAIEAFGFPKKSLTKDFSSTFTSVSEAIYYALTGDPYPESAQPYMGQTTVSYSYAGGFTPDPSRKVLLMITTRPLIDGFTFNSQNLKTRSRYVILSSDDHDFTFNYMHPGSYYAYAFYDNDGNGTFNSGDWCNSINVPFTLSPEGTASASPMINFTIP